MSALADPTRRPPNAPETPPDTAPETAPDTAPETAPATVTATGAIAPPLRAWQRRALAALERFDRGHFLISAAPGAGKTRPALEFAAAELAARRVDSVVIACPTAPLTRQWARAAHGLGLELAPDAEFPRPPRGFDGVAVTYARIAMDPRRWGAAAGSRTLVVADEAHHLGEELTWGETFAAAFREAPRWLLLSGTPFRSDATPIPGVSYDSAGFAEPDVAYTYAESVRDGVCRPVVFVTYDGALSWRSGDEVIESSFDEVLSTREAGRRYRTAISTELPDGLPRILKEADDRLRRLRAAGGHPNAGGLVVAADSSHARRVAGLLREATGRAPVVVLHQDARAAQRLAAFTDSRDPWIVAVNMVSEGVDIPRLRVGVYATAAKTPLIFRQIVGRFVRSVPGSPPEPSWLYIPADPVLRAHAQTIEQEAGPSIRRGGTEDEELLDEPAERTQTEPSAGLDFEPLAADVAPQMTLFGGAPAAAAPIRPAIAIPTPAPPTPPTPGTPGPARVPAGRGTTRPAFERRAALRAERHRLVSELGRREGRSHQEINRWLNDRIGIRTVEQATISQLERSVELIVKRLTKR